MRPASPAGGDLPAGPLLAVHAHPDDETLATGVLLATWAATGRDVTVVTCTRGERGEVIDTPSHPTGLAHLEGDGPALAAHREGELSAALAALGVADHVFLDTVPAPRGELSGSRARIPAPGPDNSPDDGAPGRFEDSGMAWVAPGIAGPAPDSGPAAFSRIPLEAAAGRLAAVVRDRRPVVVATYESGGGYGHPDHVRTHEVTARAVELAADPSAAVPGEPWAPELWEAVTPASEVRAARRSLAADPGVRRRAGECGLTFPDPDAPLPPVARDDELLVGERTARVAVAPVLERLLAAMAAHATQVQHAARVDDDGGVLAGCYALSNAVLAPITAYEAYVRRSPVGSPR